MPAGGHPGLRPARALHAQEAKVTFRLQEKLLLTLLSEIQKQTGYKIFYSDNNVDVSRGERFGTAGSREQSARIDPSKLGLTYQFINTIVLSQDPKAKQTRAGKRHARPSPSARGIGRSWRRSGQAGGRRVGGGEQDKRRGTSTAADGSFSFRVPTDETQIIISMIGMKSQTLQHRRQMPLEITMKADVIESEALVVTGLRSQSQKQLHGYGNAGEGRRPDQGQPDQHAQSVAGLRPFVRDFGPQRRIRFEPQLHSRPHRNPR